MYAFLFSVLQYIIMFIVRAISDLIVVFSDDPECKNKSFKCTFKNSMEFVVDISVALFIFTMATQIKVTLR